MRLTYFYPIGDLNIKIENINPISLDEKRNNIN